MKHLDFLRKKIQNRSTAEPNPISGKKILCIIGVLALSLPIVLVVGSWWFCDCDGVQSSISIYYHSVMRNFFVGAACAIAVCMFAYDGYSDIDSKFAKAAGIFALGVAFFPTSVDQTNECINILVGNGIISTMHFVSAGLLFFMLALFCLLLFVMTKNPTRQKKCRNKVYKICGWGILVCMALIGLYFGVGAIKSLFVNYNPVFYLETCCLLLFSFAWLVKGGVLWSD